VLQAPLENARSQNPRKRWAEVHILHKPVERTMGWLDDIVREKKQAERERGASAEEASRRSRDIHRSYDRMVRRLLHDVAKACFGSRNYWTESKTSGEWRLLREPKRTDIIGVNHEGSHFWVHGNIHAFGTSFNGKTKDCSEEELRRVLRDLVSATM